MTERIERRTYVFEAGSTDQERLKLAADRLNEGTYEACVRAGARPGDRVLDVGCGPGGALPLLAELVGAAGVVIGLDTSAEALAAASASLAARGVANVHLLEADVNVLAPDALAEWAPFDIAHCRLVLTHQPDPAATLRAVARLLRPGGRIIALDPLRSACFPRLDPPPMPAVERIIQLDIAHL
jgi:ubiquinone/menaquinone biosynthesis C-methylase UbiE